MRPRRERARGNLFPNRLSGVPQKNGTTRPLSRAPALGPAGVLIYKTTILAAYSFSLQECRGSDIRNSPDQCQKLVVGRTTYQVVQSCLRSEEHTSELQSHSDLVCRLLLEKKKKK